MKFNMKNNKGFAPLAIILIVVGIVVSGAAGIAVKKSKNPNFREKEIKGEGPTYKNSESQTNKPLQQVPQGKCGDGICSVKEKSNPSMCLKDCAVKKDPAFVPVKNTTQTTCEYEGEVCGGITGKLCCEGFSCALNGNYPDAEGKCEKIDAGAWTLPGEIKKDISSVKLLKSVDIDAGARPEVVSASDRVFVIYLDTSEAGNSKFSVKIFDKDMNEEIAYKTLVSKSEYGAPTDIRVAYDKNYIYAFYETADMVAQKSYLFGAKYTLNDSFERVSYTSTPVATSKTFGSHGENDEHLDDPIVVIGESSVFSITRIMPSSAITYVIREFDKSLNFKSEKKLDNLAQSKGDYGQASAVYYNNNYYLVLPSLDSSMDLLLMKFDTDWNKLESKYISKEAADEYFITGMKVYNDNFFITYKKGEISDSSAELKVYDSDFNMILSETVRTLEVKGESQRTSLDVNNGRIYVGLPIGGGPPPMGKTITTTTTSTKKVARIYIYEIQ